MARKEAKPTTRIWPRRTLARAIAATALGLGLIGGIVLLGTVAAGFVGGRDRYRIPLADLEFAPPDWVDRETFLAEIRYLGDLPETFNVHDPVAVERVRTAIANHPWVDFVAGEGELTVSFRYNWTVGFRRPVLAVTTSPPPRLRTVDSKGVLLPPHQPITNLARLVGEVEPPSGPAGTSWNNPVVRRAAELAGQYESDSIERIGSGWRITRRNGPPLVVDR